MYRRTKNPHKRTYTNYMANIDIQTANKSGTEKPTINQKKINNKRSYFESCILYLDMVMLQLQVFGCRKKLIRKVCPHFMSQIKLPCSRKKKR